MLLLVIVALGVGSLLLGKASATPAEVVSALLGQGTKITGFVIGELRLPRTVTAIVVGVCLGVSGALLQTTLRNPLASPDIIGVTASASVAGIVGMISFDLSGFTLALAVIAGSLLAAALMYLLAWREGLSAYRLVLVGIGIAAVCAGVVSFVLSRSDIRDAQIALVWVTGSLNNSTWQAVLPVAACGAVLLALTTILLRTIRTLELGDDTAGGLGVPVERSRLGIIACAVALTAVAVSVAGPLGFVALASGQIARRLVGAGGSGILMAGLVGPTVLLAADLTAQFSWPGVSFPTGVVTGLVGAPLLIWLLVRASRTGTGS
ncbi:iron chelate uptake ABC transporter family permease subunit [Microbacterium sp. cx-59]|uniref:FecCD family ABC transporter permease n=1 Tax=Microbacterium sp. cx-59 TaxID=2891207 RepID=UPI001E5BD332|nr:iron chelate uptake ABC transporter family permease subunit [Microbacterium sp. cx-59]MCC4909223.1 iron chelate uptake ABC transporter family permease subunit [Microbacterium sp. cx-59]